MNCLSALLLFVTLFVIVSGDRQSDFDDIRKKSNLPALAGYVQSTNIHRNLVSGVRKMGDPTLATTSDSWHLGSNTKSITATLVAVAIEKGLFKWTSPISKVLPRLASIMHPGFKDVPIELFTAMFSGVASDLNYYTKLDYSQVWILDPVKSRAAVVKEILSNPPQHPPGSKYHYSNLNLVIIGHILDLVFETPWEKSVDTYIFKPLGMKNCGLGNAASSDLLSLVGIKSPDQPWPHAYWKNPIEPLSPTSDHDNHFFYGPAGLVNCPLTEYAKYAKAHINGWNNKSTPILKAESFRKLHTPLAPWYTYGCWGYEKDYNGEVMFYHSGSNVNNYIAILVYPARDDIVISATNLGGNIAYDAILEAFGPLYRNKYSFR